MGNQQSLDEQVFNIKFTAKQLHKQHDKLLAQEKKDRAMVKKVSGDGVGMKGRFEKRRDWFLCVHGREWCG